jgi:glucokinase
MSVLVDDFVLGIDLGGTKIALATADANGTILYQQTIATLASQGAEQAIARTIASGRDLVEQTRRRLHSRLAGVGIATMGITLDDRVLMAPNVPGWDRLALPSQMQQAFVLDAIRIENDVKAAAFAELRWGALAGVETGLYLNLGTGIAATPVVNGRILRGTHGAAGEIAYNLRHLHDEQGFSAGKAPLEEFVGGGAIRERVRLRFGTEATVEEIFRKATVAPLDPEARAFVEATLTEIAFHLTNMTIALDPERVVIGGGLMRSKALILPRLAAHIRRFVPFPPQVEGAHFSHDAGIMGAIALAIP